MDATKDRKHGDMRAAEGVEDSSEEAAVRLKPKDETKPVVQRFKGRALQAERTASTKAQRRDSFVCWRKSQARV